MASRFPHLLNAFSRWLHGEIVFCSGAVFEVPVAEVMVKSESRVNDPQLARFAPGRSDPGLTRDSQSDPVSVSTDCTGSLTITTKGRKRKAQKCPVVAQTKSPHLS